jgi:uncharacterized protein
MKNTATYVTVFQFVGNDGSQKRLIMQIIEMTESDCRETLVRNTIGRLACSRHDQPYILPIYFVYESDLLFAFTTDGQKVDWMRTNPKVCVEIDEISNHFQWTSVVLRGRYRELPDLPPFAEERDHARKLLATRSLWWQTAYASHQLKSPRDVLTPLFYCIEIDSMTGHRAAASVGESEDAAGLTPSMAISTGE